GQPVVESQHVHFIEPLPGLLPLARFAVDPVIAKTSQGGGQPRIIGRDHAAFAGGQVFYRVKAEHSHVGQAADSFSPYSAPSAWQASSIRRAPCSFAIPLSSSSAAGWPA